MKYKFNVIKNKLIHNNVSYPFVSNIMILYHNEQYHSIKPQNKTPVTNVAGASKILIKLPNLIYMFCILELLSTMSIGFPSMFNPPSLRSLI